MPELPEVETVRRLAERVLAGQRIEHVEAVQDPVVYDRAPPLVVQAALDGRVIEGVRRKGKYFWFQLDRPPHPVFHFGMAGRFPLIGAEDPPPKYWKLVLTVSDGTTAAFTDMRRLGRIRLSAAPESEPPISLLGFDALTELPTGPQFQRLLQPRRGPLKAVLLDQGFSAGVGNWVADEVLYQACLSPLRPANQLTAPEVRRLRAAVKLIVQTAVEVEADSERFPPGWLFHRRWDHRIGTSAAGERLQRQKVGGRTTTWAPDRQH